MPELDVSAYTPMLRRLIRAIGVGGTTMLLRWRGGCRLCLPQKADRSELQRYLTFAQTQALIDEFGPGMAVTLPKPDKLYIAARNAQIRGEHAQGDSLTTLALRHGMTKRHIMNILGAPDGDATANADDERQTRLF